MISLCYHGSEENFDEFSLEHVGEKNGITGGGYGLYFTTNKTDALTYGNNLYEVMLMLENNISNNKVTLSDNILRIILDKTPDYYSQNKVSYTERKSFRKELLFNSESDIALIANIINACYNGDCTDMLKILCGLGYNYTQDNETPEDDLTTHYIVYDSSAIIILNKFQI